MLELITWTSDKSQQPVPSSNRQVVETHQLLALQTAGQTVGGRDCCLTQPKQPEA